MHKRVITLHISRFIHFQVQHLSSSVKTCLVMVMQYAHFISGLTVINFHISYVIDRLPITIHIVFTRSSYSLFELYVYLLSIAIPSLAMTCIILLENCIKAQPIIFAPSSMLIESDGISNGYQNRLSIPGVMIADQPFPNNA